MFTYQYVISFSFHYLFLAMYKQFLLTHQGRGNLE